MKTAKLSVLIGLFLLIHSCATNKSFVRNFEMESKFGKEPGSDVFVIRKNGQKVEGKKLTYSHSSIWRVEQKENWIAVDGQKIQDSEYEIIQTEKAYRHLYFPDDTRFGRPFFINRLRYGKINLYYYQHNALANGKDVRGDYHVYVFEKEKGKLISLDYDSFSNALSDKKDALRKFSQLYPKGKIPTFSEKGNLANLIQVTELYNKN
jgi:hypothetical protein